MKVKIIAATEKPIDVISLAAGTSYAKEDARSSRVWNCLKLGHMSVFEHATFTARVEGVSRACSHQLVRHRLASYVEQSQRYTKIDTINDNWFVIPPEIEHSKDEDVCALFLYSMGYAGGTYKRCLDAGIKPEDARYVLPQATKTAITVSMNVREFFNFYDLRADKAAQWEIRELAEKLDTELAFYNKQWGDLLNIYHNGIW